MRYLIGTVIAVIAATLVAALITFAAIASDERANVIRLERGGEVTFVFFPPNGGKVTKP